MTFTVPSQKTGYALASGIRARLTNPYRSVTTGRAAVRGGARAVILFL